MTESFISLCCANSYWTNAGCYVSNTAITLSQAQTDKTSTRHDGPLCWLVLGKQPQWGKSTSTGEYVTHTFPIKFTVIPIVVAGALTSNTSGNTGSQSNPCYRSITVSNFVFCMYDNARGYAGSTYIAIGYQLQWGFTLFEPVDYKNINFTLPLAVNGTFCAFSTGYDAKGSTFLWHSMSHFNNINVGVTGFVFDSRYTFTGLGYLAICWQKQWGYAALTSQNKSVSTNITMPNNNYIVQLTSDFTVTSDGYGALACVSRSTTNFIVTKDFGETNKHAFWLIIG